MHPPPDSDASVAVFRKNTRFQSYFELQVRFLRTTPHFDLTSGIPNNPLENCCHFNYILKLKAFYNRFSGTVTIFWGVMTLDTTQNRLAGYAFLIEQYDLNALPNW
ncbi:MAG: hypothetical protein RQ722_02635, partial [Desulfuromonadales bacterium]|nr:hypothetical protein [Desulfuromonadales bacterium]